MRKTAYPSQAGRPREVKLIGLGSVKIRTVKLICHACRTINSKSLLAMETLDHPHPTAIGKRGNCKEGKRSSPVTLYLDALRATGTNKNPSEVKIVCPYLFCRRLHFRANRQGVTTAS